MAAILRLFILAALTSPAALPIIAVAQGTDLPPSSLFEYDAQPGDRNSGIKNIHVRATESLDESTDNTFPAEFIVGKSEVDAITVVVADEATQEGPRFLARAKKFVRNIRTRITQTVTAPKAVFGEWFQKNQRRLAIVSFEVTLISGFKYTELMLSPQPVSHAAALAAALLTGFAIGSVEWNIQTLFRFILTKGTFVTQIFNRISSNWKNPNTQESISKVLDEVWKYTKNTSVNFALFNVIKLVLYSTVGGHGELLNRILDAIDTTVTFDQQLGSARDALLATIVSYPTTKVIIAFGKSLTAKANGDPDLLLKVRDKITLAQSSALTARALLLMTKIVAVAFKMPAMNTAANIALGGMFVGSIGKLIYDGYKAKACNKAFDPNMPDEPINQE